MKVFGKSKKRATETASSSDIFSNSISSDSGSHSHQTYDFKPIMFEGAFNQEKRADEEASTKQSPQTDLDGVFTDDWRQPSVLPPPPPKRSEKETRVAATKAAEPTPKKSQTSATPSTSPPISKRVVTSSSGPGRTDLSYWIDGATSSSLSVRKSSTQKLLETASANDLGLLLRAHDLVGPLFSALHSFQSDQALQLSCMTLLSLLFQDELNAESITSPPIETLLSMLAQHPLLPHSPDTPDSKQATALTAGSPPSSSQGTAPSSAATKKKPQFLSAKMKALQEKKDKDAVDVNLLCAHALKASPDQQEDSATSESKIESKPSTERQSRSLLPMPPSLVSSYLLSPQQQSDSQKPPSGFLAGLALQSLIAFLHHQHVANLLELSGQQMRTSLSGYRNSQSQNQSQFTNSQSQSFSQDHDTDSPLTALPPSPPGPTVAELRQRALDSVCQIAVRALQLANSEPSFLFGATESRSPKRRRSGGSSGGATAATGTTEQNSTSTSSDLFSSPPQTSTHKKRKFPGGMKRGGDENDRIELFWTLEICLSALEEATASTGGGNEQKSLQTLLATEDTGDNLDGGDKVTTPQLSPYPEFARRLFILECPNVLSEITRFAISLGQHVFSKGSADSERLLACSLRILVNLTNGDPLACLKVGEFGGVSCAFRLLMMAAPQHVDTQQSKTTDNKSSGQLSSYDMAILCLGLLTNLVEHSQSNCEAFQNLKYELSLDPLDYLLSLFLRTREVYSDRTESEGDSSSQQGLFLEPAQLESFFASSYSALVLGALLFGNPAWSETTKQRLPGGSLATLVEVLERFVDIQKKAGLLNARAVESVSQILGFLKA